MWCIPISFQLAEKFFVEADCTKDAIDMYNNAGKWEQAHRVKLHHTSIYGLVLTDIMMVSLVMFMV